MRFRKPELIPLLFIIAATLVLGGLGAWQVERLQWKNALVAAIKKAGEEPALTKLPNALDGLEYRRVEIAGKFLHSKALRLVGGIREAGPGFFILAPLKMDDGRVILVNRGFAPDGKEGAPMGMQKVVGVLRPLREKRFFSPENKPEKNLWFYEDAQAMAQVTGLSLLPLVVEATGKREKEVYPIPRDVDNIAGSMRNDHLNYAITWFAVMIIGWVMFGFYHRIPENKA